MNYFPQKPNKNWKNYCKLYCSECDKEFYRENVGLYAICAKCDGFCEIVRTYLEKSESIPIVKKEEITHIHQFPNGEKRAITNKGNILSSYDTYSVFKKSAKREEKLRKKMPTRSDFKILQ